MAKSTSGFPIRWMTHTPPLSIENETFRGKQRRHHTQSDSKPAHRTARDEELSPRLIPPECKPQAENQQQIDGDGGDVERMHVRKGGKSDGQDQVKR